MLQNSSPYFLLDFDSTIIQSEGMEELAEIALANHPQPQKDIIIKKIKKLTEQGMTGEISFNKSLVQRLQLLEINTSHIEQLGKILQKKISPSILRNKQFFMENQDTIFIISGGFKEFIIPVVEKLCIPSTHVYANTFIFDDQGSVMGIDTHNPLAHDDGKVTLVKSLHLGRNTIVIGDGYTDYRLKESGLIPQFIAFTENVEREAVAKKADHIANSFEKVLQIIGVSEKG